MNRKKSLIAMVFVAQALAITSASAGVYNFTYDVGGSDAAFGRLVTQNIGSGLELAISGWITKTAGVGSGTFALIQNPNGNANYSTNTWFNYNDVLYPDAADKLDTYGLLFGDGGSKSINIWFDNGAYTLYGYGFGNGYEPAVTGKSFALQSVPGPVAVLPFALGLLAAARRRRK